MLRVSDFTGLVDALSLELLAKHPNRVSSIASLGSAFKAAIGKLFTEGQTLTRYADILDVCSALDATNECTAEPDLTQDVLQLRERAYKLLSQKIYAAKLQSAQSDGRTFDQIGDEYRIAQRVADWCKAMRGRIPATFSPEWIEEHCEPTFVLAVKEYIYRINGNAFDWAAFAALLPESLRRTFDSSRMSLPVPSGFVNDDEALAYFLRLIAHHGLTLQDIAYKDRIPALLELPGFRIVLEYFGDRRWEENLRQSDGDSQADSSSPTPLPT